MYRGHTVESYAPTRHPNHTPKPYAHIITTVGGSIKGHYPEVDVTQRFELLV